MNELLVDKNGAIRNFNDFKKEVFKVHKKHNRNYLRTEYQTAKASAQMSRKWLEFERQKHIYPNLKYITVGDDRVREEHAKLNGIIKPINDPFWDDHYPPNDFNCRCSVTSTKEEADKHTVSVPIDERFQQNVGKTNKVFNQEHHPYFSIPNTDQKPVSIALEKHKEQHPNYFIRHKSKNGARVLVSPYADTRYDELLGNYRVAVKIADILGLDVKLAPHIDRNLVSGKNPEYIIGKKIADRKAPESLNYKNSIKKANKQGAEVVVIDLEKNRDSIENCLNKVKTTLKRDEAHPNIKEVFIVSKDRKTIDIYKRKKQS